MLKFSNRVYDILKKISMMALPLTTFVVTFSKLWGIEMATALRICGTISAFATLLGACLEISTKNYNEDMIDTGDDDAIHVDEDGGLG